MINFILFALGWKIINDTNVLVFKKESKKWICNLNASFNSMFIITSICLDLKDYTNNIYYAIAKSYFFYDLFNHEILSTFWNHHIVSIYAMHLMELKTGIDAKYAREILLSFELGNIFLYIAHGILSHRNGNKLVKKNTFKMVIITEFITYTFFRVIIPSIYLSCLSRQDQIMLLLFQLASAIWSIKLFKGVIKLFSKN